MTTTLEYGVNSPLVQALIKHITRVSQARHAASYTPPVETTRKVLQPRRYKREHDELSIREPYEVGQDILDELGTTPLYVRGVNITPTQVKQILRKGTDRLDADSDNAANVAVEEKLREHGYSGSDGTWAFLGRSLTERTDVNNPLHYARRTEVEGGIPALLVFQDLTHIGDAVTELSAEPFYVFTGDPRTHLVALYTWDKTPRRGANPPPVNIDNIRSKYAGLLDKI